MPLWLVSFGSGVLGFFRKRPIAILYALIIAGVVAFGLHYRGIVDDLATEKANNATLELSLKTQKDATDAVEKRAKEIAQDLVEFGITIEALEEVGRNVRAENRRLRSRIDSLELERLAVEQPELAADTATREFNDSLRVLECETFGSRHGSCRPSGEDAAEAAAP